MDDNIERQLDDAVTFLNEYWPLYNVLRGRGLMLRMLLRYPRILPLVTSGKVKLKYDVDVLSGKTSELARILLPVLVAQKERESHAFEAFTHDYSIDYISRKLEEALNGADFGKIKMLHDSKKKGLEFIETGIIGIVLSASSLVLNTVPQRVVVTTFKTDYADFEVWVFWFTMAAVVYAALFILLAWSSVRKANHKHEFISQILEYTSIRKGTT